MLSNNLKFFNKKSLVHAFFMVSFLVASDLFIYFSNAENALSISFYIKLAVCIMYVFMVKEEGRSQRESGSLECAFHILLVVCGFLLAVTSYMISGYPPSKSIGVFLVFGLFGLFNITVELNRFFYIDNCGVGMVFSAIMVFLKLLFVVTICASVLFLMVGEWRWDIKPFYEW